MNWYSGDIGQCIKEVKNAQKLLLVFSKDSEDISSESCAALNAEDVVMHCQDVICLQLQSGSVPYHQFASVYEVPSLPCIHIISPSGLVLSVKTADFSADRIALWLAENIASFETTKQTRNAIMGVQELAPVGAPYDTSPKACASASPPSSYPQAIGNLTASAEHSLPRSEKAEVLELYEGDPPASLPEADVAASPLTSSPRPGSNSECVDLGHQRCQETDQVERNLSPEEIPSSALSEADASVPSHRSGNSLNERIQDARELLEAKRQAKAVKVFQETHESELKRRNLGRDMVEFKRRKQEQEIRERLEEQKREKAEKQAARQRILAQIELDRRDRLGVSAPKVAAPKSTTTSTGAVDPNEVRLQLRLPDGSHMIGVFAAEAHLGSEVRQYIRSRVQGKEAEGALAVAPLSDVVRASFAPVLASGFTFRQTRPNPPRHFSPEDETTKTLRELGLWPSAVLILHCGKYNSITDDGFAGYSKNVLSRVLGLIWGGVQSVGDIFFYFGDGLIQLGRSTWQTLFSAGSGRTIGQAQAANSATSRQSPPRTDGDREKSPDCHTCLTTQMSRQDGMATRQLSFENQSILKLVIFWHTFKFRLIGCFLLLLLNMAFTKPMPK
uniref:UBX domain-containing protein 4 n=1 Tax=Echinococcus granulosus TaxID=6210 RepID=A0A068WFA9_ECHGR|nr:UBX domain containing protein 2 [Echinococcus granulosus]